MPDPWQLECCSASVTGLFFILSSCLAPGKTVNRDGCQLAEFSVHMLALRCVSPTNDDGQNIRCSFQNFRVSTEPVTAARAREIHGDHIVLLDSNGKLVALFSMDIVRR